jgi:hypothetical protein
LSNVTAHGNGASIVNPPMKIIFNPPQLGVARQAATLRSLAQELAPADCTGELRVLHPYRDEPLRLVLIQSGRWPASIELPRTRLYEEHAEYELRERLAELFHAAAKPVLAH